MTDSYDSGTFRVAVLSGGDAAEREISIQSGEAVAAAIQQKGHFVNQLDPAEADLRRIDWSDFDVVFIALHGTFGEDGQVQRILEDAIVPFTGTGSLGSRMAFSKSSAKECFRRAGVPTPDYVLIHESDNIARLSSMAGLIGYPLVVKPDQQGSSLGVSIVGSTRELVAAADKCFQFGPFGIMERAVTGGGEWTLGVVDTCLLPLMKISPGGEFFDYSSKYEDDQTGYTFDFEEPESATVPVVSAGLSACQALGTNGIARVDLLVDEAGRPWVLEVNTVPGMTDHSLVPKAAVRAGISLPELCDREIRCALRRHSLRHNASHRLERPPIDIHRRAG